MLRRLLRCLLQWVMDNALGPKDELHLVCVALPIPYPVSRAGHAGLCRPIRPPLAAQCTRFPAQFNGGDPRVPAEGRAAARQACAASSRPGTGQHCSWPAYCCRSLLRPCKHSSARLLALVAPASRCRCCTRLAPKLAPGVLLLCR